jgi:hypothetical protein
MKISMPNEVRISDKEELLAFLDSHWVPVDIWGKDQAKTVDHLVRELLAGESHLEVEGGMVLWCSVCSGVLIDIEVDGVKLVLKENLQRFRDGRIRRRQDVLDGMSIAEKLRPGERPHDGATRAIREELGLDIPVDLKLDYQGSRRIGPEPSRSYPGLMSRYVRNDFHWSMPPRFFNPMGYIEHQPDKDTYFVWHPVD